MDLNCDLGEGEPPTRTRALMRQVTSANVACGGHAGDVKSMRLCVRLTKQFRLKLGAHPGTRDGFGRVSVAIDAAALELLLLQQVSALERIAKLEGVKLHHIKLHGALYHATERDPKLARGYLETVGRWWPNAIVYAFASGSVASVAPAVGVQLWGEAFLDRNYNDDGSLVSRDQPGAMLTNPSDVAERIRLLTSQEAIKTQSGKTFPVAFQTMCIHGDTPNAVRIAQLARRALS